MSVHAQPASSRTRPLSVGLLLPDTEGQLDGATPRWSDLREWRGWRRTVGFDSIWVTDHFIHRPRDGSAEHGPWECWSLLAATGGHHRPRRARHARHLHRLPQPGAAGQDGRHRRGDQRRPAHPGHRRRLERAGVPRLRLPLRPPRRPLRGGAGDHQRACCATGTVDFDGHVLPGP